MIKVVFGEQAANIGIFHMILKTTQTIRILHGCLVSKQPIGI